MTRPGGPGRRTDADQAVVAGIDVDRVAAAVVACPLVAGLVAGDHGTAATLLPGRRVVGVRVDDRDGGPARIAVTVAARYGAPLTRLVEQVREAVAVRAPGHPVDVAVTDVT
ncbi:hypothetical protein [Actinomycetospora straminea]|uniref:Asp23/Gls24 family envelope stress response protein n=1 Tax=Actinomycetospora straminea TaxID=663607 RepID=A0ABP9EMC0_9PSEU|nr:hypothetical protein [Actinomycetospora straminea]MDD7933249.1 hypothetical protein [Actinomycetospora straminea]